MASNETSFDLQAAIDAAKSGDVIEVPSGFTVRTPVILPPQPHRGWITIRAEAT